MALQSLDRNNQQMQVYQPQMKSIKDKFPKGFLNNEAIGKQYKTIKKEINKDDLIYKISYKKVLRHLRQYDFLKKVSECWCQRAIQSNP